MNTSAAAHVALHLDSQQMFFLHGSMISAFTQIGGTIAGCARFLKPRCGVTVILADPPGSGLCHKVRNDVMYSGTQAEGKRRRNQVDTVVEGVGSQRMTAILDLVLGGRRNQPEFANNSQFLPSNGRWIDDAISVSDQEAIYMSRFIMNMEGLFIGSSSSVNMVAVVKLSRWLHNLPDGKWMGKSVRSLKIASMLCDDGVRHLNKFWSDSWVVGSGFDISEQATLDFVEPLDANFLSSLTHEI